MSTNINITVDKTRLLDQVRLQQAASRTSQSDKEKEKNIKNEARTKRTKKLESEGLDENGKPKLGYSPSTLDVNRRLGANRPGNKGVVAAQISIIPVGDNLELKVGTPNFAASTTKQIQSQTANIPNPTLPPTYQNIPNPLPIAGTVSRFRVSGLYLWFVAGTPVISAVPPPTSASIQIGYSTIRNYSGTQDRRYMLPLTKDSSVLIYVVNRLLLRHVYSITEQTDITSENARSSPPNETFSSIVTYDQKRISATSKNLFNTETFSDYSINCFFVSKESVKQIGTPQALDAAIRLICPPLTANSTNPIQSVYARSERYIGEGPGAGESYFVTFPDIMGTEQSINLQDWRSSGYYGDYNAANQTLALHFGFLPADTDYSSRFFTPAVFNFIERSVVIDNNSKQYSYMRTNFFSRAPIFFLEQCRVLTVIDGVQEPASCQGSRADFDVTLVEPVTIEDQVDSIEFTANEKYAVDLNGSTFDQIGYQLIYSWNWNDSNYCFQQAVTLGFPGEDLVP